MATPQQYLVLPTTGIDQSMVELLAEVLEVEPHQVIETALHGLKNGLKQTSCVLIRFIATRNRSTLNFILNHD